MPNSELRTSRMIFFSSSAVNLKTDFSSSRRRAGGADGGGMGDGGENGEGGNIGGGGPIGGAGGIDGEIIWFARVSVSRSWSKDQIPAMTNPVRIPMLPTANRTVPVDDMGEPSLLQKSRAFLGARLSPC
jgi:hypothetical protein